MALETLNFGDAIVRRHLPRRDEYRECYHPNRQMHIASSKAGKVEPSEPFETKVSDTKHGARI